MTQPQFSITSFLFSQLISSNGFNGSSWNDTAGKIFSDGNQAMFCTSAVLPPVDSRRNGGRVSVIGPAPLFFRVGGWTSAPTWANSNDSIAWNEQRNKHNPPKKSITPSTSALSRLNTTVLHRERGEKKEGLGGKKFDLRWRDFHTCLKQTEDPF